MFKFLVGMLFSSVVKNKPISIVFSYLACLICLFSPKLTQWFLYFREVRKPFMFLSFLVLGACFSWGERSRSAAKMNLFSDLIYLIIFRVSLCLSSKGLLILYLILEATIIPTVIMISRFGSNPERLSARVYLFGYMLVTILPFIFLIRLIWDAGRGSWFCLN